MKFPSIAAEGLCQKVLARITYRGSDNPVKVASPEDNTGSGVRCLVLNTETSPHGVVRACGNRSDEEGEDVCDGVDLAGDAHVEEHNRTNEHAQETNQKEVANRVGVVIGEGDNRLLLARSLLLQHHTLGKHCFRTTVRPKGAPAADNLSFDHRLSLTSRSQNRSKLHHDGKLCVGLSFQAVPCSRDKYKLSSPPRACVVSRTQRRTLEDTGLAQPDGS
jgi:hypothetical protein